MLCRTHRHDAVWLLRCYEFGLLSVCALQVYFLFRPEPPVEPRTHFSVRITPRDELFDGLEAKKKTCATDLSLETWLLIGPFFILVIKDDPKRYELSADI